MVSAVRVASMGKTQLCIFRANYLSEIGVVLERFTSGNL